MMSAFDDIARLERAQRKYMTRRERIEDGLELEWYTVDEAAEELDLHPKTVRSRLREGKLKASRPSPRKTRIHYTDLAAYMSRLAGSNS
jgi:excisionase family DNA binding protein